MIIKIKLTYNTYVCDTDTIYIKIVKRPPCCPLLIDSLFKRLAFLMQYDAVTERSDKLMTILTIIISYYYAACQNIFLLLNKISIFRYRPRCPISIVPLLQSIISLM